MSRSVFIVTIFQHRNQYLVNYLNRRTLGNIYVNHYEVSIKIIVIDYINNWYYCCKMHSLVRFLPSRAAMITVLLIRYYLHLCTQRLYLTVRKNLWTQTVRLTVFIFFMLLKF